jgi:murein DD-endopeptidase MepM/ murein hydrolase activator NlpD
MKFKSTDSVNIRSGPGVNNPKIGNIPAGTIVESDEYSWKAVTLPDGTKGFCAATFLEAVPDTAPAPAITSKWCAPIRADKFVVTQKFLTPDAVNYPITGVHPGTDYGTKQEDNVPLFFCADGEVIETGANHKYFGNHFFYYVPEVDRTFVYFHLRDSLPTKGLHKAGEQCGITGQTGLSYGIHLHLECMKGRKTSADRSSLYKSKAALMAAAEDADAFIRPRL